RLCGPLVLGADGRRQDSAHPPPAAWPDVVRALVPPAALPLAPSLPLTPWRAAAPRRVGWLVGCAVIARTSLLARLGPFDERLFLYGEDLDLGLRAAQAGVESWFWPGARVLHHGAHASGRAFGGEPFEALAAARHDVIERRLGAPRARLDDRLQALTFASRVAVKSLLRRPAQRERRQRAAIRTAQPTQSVASGPLWAHPSSASTARVYDSSAGLAENTPPENRSSPA